MSALTTERATKFRSGARYFYPLVDEAKIYKGSIVAIVDGEVRPAADVAGLRVIGMALDTVDNAADGLGVDVEPGVHLWENSATHAVGVSSLNRYCYVEDDQTVNSTGGTHKVIAGIPVEVTADGVWVDSRPASMIAAQAMADQDAAVASKVTPTYAAPSAVTYVAPTGGSTTDAEARAAIVQLAADNVATRAAQAKTAVDVAAIITALQAAGLMAE